jgi:hypothetical protein
MNHNFTVLSVVINSFKTFKENYKFYFGIGALFFVLTIAFNLISIEVFKAFSGSFLILIIISLINLMIYTKLAVSIHQSVILKDYSIKNKIKWGSPEGSFFLLILFVGIVAIISYLVLTAMIFFFIPDEVMQLIDQKLAVFISAVLYLSLGFLISRIALVFPAAAVGHELSFPDAWQISNHYMYRLFALLVLIPVILSIASNLIYAYLEINPMIIHAVFIPVTIFEVIILSHCYDALVQKQIESIDQNRLEAID